MSIGAPQRMAGEVTWPETARELTGQKLRLKRQFSGTVDRSVSLWPWNRELLSDIILV